MRVSQAFGEREDEQEDSAEFVYADRDEALLPQECLNAAERTELVAWLKKLADTHDRDFKPNEQAQIRREIEELYAKVEELKDLNLNQKEAIDKLLAEVQSGSERMSRKDWVTCTIGAATSLVLMEIVPPLALLHLAAHAIHALGHLLIDA